MGSRIVGLLVVLLLGWGLIGGLAFFAENADARSQEVKLAEINAEASKSFEAQAMDDLKTVAVAGFAANTAIAASGDMAQASLGRSMATTVVAIAAIVMALAYIMYNVGKKNSSSSYNYISEDSYVDHNSVRR